MAVGSEASQSNAPGGHGRAAGQGLDRQAILDAASALIERDGLAALTMRRLGRELDVTAMSLYRYIPGREHLIDWVVDLVVDELYADPEVLLLPTGGWQDYLTRLASGLRRMALAHPHLFPLVATRPPSAPWVRPPLRSLRWIESFLAALNSQGVSDDTAVYAYRAFTGFLLGHLLLEVAARGVDISPVEGDWNTVEQPADPLQGYPTLRRLQPEHCPGRLPGRVRAVPGQLDATARGRGDRRRALPADGRSAAPCRRPGYLNERRGSRSGNRHQPPRTRRS